MMVDGTPEEFWTKVFGAYDFNRFELKVIIIK